MTYTEGDGKYVSIFIQPNGDWGMCHHTEDGILYFDGPDEAGKFVDDNGEPLEEELLDVSIVGEEIIFILPSGKEYRFPADDPALNRDLVDELVPQAPHYCPEQAVVYDDWTCCCTCNKVRTDECALNI